MRKVRAENGQALVEFAFVLPLLLLFLFAIIDFGIALNQQNADTNIANIAVRDAAVIGTTTSQTCGSTTETTLGAWVQCESTSIGGPALTSVCVGDIATSTSPASGTYTSGDPIEVKVTSSFSWLKIVSQASGGPSSSIASSATMRMEGSLTGTNPFLSPTCT
ncbi:MAG: pilus assembly protein [Actinomycetota bacterium]|nr:pilus assembly protein [Actinomycetota bacterium]